MPGKGHRTPKILAEELERKKGQAGCGAILGHLVRAATSVLFWT